ncbi:hypothetical protein F5887DRAFT_88220 [Amanita rubescens]|nr:hypothetical protein F5887DRAFT_88220 [Amanita rubescens]
MSTLAKLVRLQPRCSLSSFRLQTSRTLTTSSLVAARLYRPRAVSSSWRSPVSVRFFSTEPEPKPEENKRGRKEKLPPTKSLFVSNVPREAISEHLHEVFSPYGSIDRIYLFPARMGGHKGCGRVDFNKLEDAIAAYESAEVEPFYMMSRTLFVDYSRKHPIAPKNHTLFFRDFLGKKEDLLTVLEQYKDDIEQISFLPPFKDGQIWDRGHIVFKREGADIAEEVLNKFNGQMTHIGCPLHLEYAWKKDIETRSIKRLKESVDVYGNAFDR